MERDEKTRNDEENVDAAETTGGVARARSESLKRRVLLRREEVECQRAYLVWGGPCCCHGTTAVVESLLH